jgi:hypothetical protein
MASNPYMTLREWLDLALSLIGVAPQLTDETGAGLLSVCGLDDLAQAPLADVPKELQRLVAFAISLQGEADVFVFDGRFLMGEGTIRQRLLEKVREILNTRTALITATTPPVLPVPVRHAIAMHDGQMIYYGEPATVVPLYQRFLEAIERAAYRRERRARAKADEVGTKDTTAADSAAEPDTATAIRVLNASRRLRHVVMSPLAFEDELVRLSEHSRPVLAGPYLSNTAQELLYWVPFLAWVRSRLSPDQPVVALSRGGADPWYAHACSSYVDMYDLWPLEDFQARNVQRVAQVGGQKQLYVSEFEGEILARVAGDLGMPDAEVLHPSLIGRVWSEVWRGRLPPSFAVRRARHVRMTLDRLNGLPPSYVAVKFEYNPLFQAGDAERALVARLVRALATRGPVVVLNTGHDVDNYREGPIELGENVFALPLMPTPRHSLETQTRVLAGARAFVGTYGGLSLAAPFCGVDAFTVYSEPVGFFTNHNTMLRAAVDRLGGCSYVISRTPQVDVERVADWAFGRGRRGLLARKPLYPTSGLHLLP